MYGVLLFVLVTIPSMFVMISSMNYPVGFYITPVLEGAIGNPVLGIIFAKSGSSKKTFFGFIHTIFLYRGNVQ
jgi:hypothetical protein